MRNALNTFKSWSLARRVTVGFMVTFIAGPGLIGFLSEYATYLYALKAGVRPPVEGIPYLAPTVTILSMVIATLVAFIFWLTRGIVGYFVGNMILLIEDYAKIPQRLWEWVTRILKQELERNPLNYVASQVAVATQKFREFSLKRALFFAGAMSSAAFFFFLWLISTNNDPNAWGQSWIAAIYFFVLTLSLWRRIFIWVASGVAAVLFYAFSLSLLFNQDNYGAFLKLIGFGGEVAIEAHLDQGEPSVPMILVVRSRDWLIGRTPEGGENIEVPLHNVKKITYLRGRKGER